MWPRLGGGDLTGHAMSHGVPTSGDALIRRGSWSCLLAVLVGLCFFSPFFERPDGLRLEGEASHLMAAESLAFDGDLHYTRADFDRHLLTWLGEPPDLSLRSNSGGRHITYAVSPAYALWLAPFVRGWPRHGFAIANCLLLLWVTVAVAIRWQERRGATGPFVLGLCLFASLIFASPFVADGGLFAALASLLAFTWIARPARRDGRDLAPWAAGGLLALACGHFALNVVLLLAALFLVTGRRRRPLLAGFALSMALLLAIPWLAGGGFGTQVARFSPATGFPGVDFSADQWPTRTDAAVTATASPQTTEGSLIGYALVDRLLGRHLGILPWFPLAVPLFLGAVGDPTRRPLAWATVFWLALLVLWYPSDVEAGGALWPAGRALPLYAALVAGLGLSTTRSSATESSANRGGRGLWPVWILAVAMALWTLPVVWSSPWRAPLALTVRPSLAKEGLTAGFMAPWRQLLPYETSQRRLLEDDGASFGGLRWISLDGRGWTERQRRHLVLPTDGPSCWLVASPEPLSTVDGDALLAASDLVVQAPDHGSVRLIWSPLPGLSGPRHHALWWTAERRWLYRLRATVDVHVEGSERPPRHLILRPAAERPGS